MNIVLNGRSAIGLLAPVCADLERCHDRCCVRVKIQTGFTRFIRYHTLLVSTFSKNAIFSFIAESN
jgi:hypothetical protein